MQQSLSQQLKCYGRRNRAKPESAVTERSTSQTEDVRAAQTEDPPSVGAELQEEVSTQLEIPQTRSKKSIGSITEGDKLPSNVVEKNMPTTKRKSGGILVATEVREATRDVATLEDPDPEGGPSRSPGTIASKELVRMRVEGQSSNGGSESGRKKGPGTGASESRKTRAQLAKEGALRSAGGQTIQVKFNLGGQKSDEGQSSREKNIAATQSALAAKRRLLALATRQKEDLMLSQADDIWIKREFLEANKDKKGQPKSKEPPRSKTHWDFVLEEMTWLAKDFERERKWKLSQAKKVAFRVSRSKLDVEAREIRRLKDEEQRMRRVASSIAKEVKKFWLKVDKLVTYKQQLQIEERKKKALDKHLDFLLGQTERYSTMLAENLADTTCVLEPQTLLSLPSAPPEEIESDAIIVGQELAMASEIALTGLVAQSNDGDVKVEVEGGDEDFMLEDEEEQEDDEATLEADEALITEDERKEELAALQRESELPLEELLTLYNSKTDMSDWAGEGEEAVDSEDDEVSDEEVEPEEEDTDIYTGKSRAVEDSVTEAARPTTSSEKQFVDGIPLTEGFDLLGTVKNQVPQKVDCDNSEAFACIQMLGGKEQSPTGDKLESSVTVEKERRVGSETEHNQSSVLATYDHEKEGLETARELVTAADEQVARSDKEEIVIVQQEEEFELHPFCPDLKMPSKDTVESSQCSERGSLEGDSTLVVGGADYKTEPDSMSLSERQSLRRIHLQSTKSLDLGVMRDIQDDGDYIPAAMADGNDEDDDEGTLEEEERFAKEEGDGGVNEIDQLKLESEMTLEELMAKYKSVADDNDQESDDFSEDRRDSTSEAGTSGSSDEEEDDNNDYSMARDIAEAKERMGEPSTSGRDHPTVPSFRNGKWRQPIATLEVKQEIVESKLPSKLEGFQKIDVHGKLDIPADVGRREKNGVLKDTFWENGLSRTPLLLEVDGEVDAEIAQAVSKVTEAARRRGERVGMRISKEDKNVLIHSKFIEDTQTGEAASPMAGDRTKSEISDVQVPVVPNTLEARTTNIGPSLVAVASDYMPVSGDFGIELSVVKSEDEGMIRKEVAIGPRNIKEGTEPAKDGLEKHASADLEVPEAVEGKSNEDTLADFAAAAASAQPTGYTFSTTKVKTKLPFLLKHSLREYQHIGLDWLVTMYEKRLNGILADEMGLGKTIMTIALLAHLACEKGIWGPHLIVVPTSVMLNWETEFMKWCPAFKILTYFGSAKERKLKRQGWSRPNSFHVCITTYRLVIQDAKAFKRKKWKYLILDEAHLIKNWKSQRWQTLLNFNSKRRILLTGTPLQNDLMELWSLMHFLMPHVFQSHQEFRDWFSNPITGMVEGQEQVNKELVDRLHNVLRPFLLRRLKKDVEKQLPGKFEHVIHCRLSKRQRNLYEDFMASSDTQATLSSGNFLGLINVLMQLRKVCNHPDLFEGRPIISSFDMPGIQVHLSSAACSAMAMGPFDGIDMEALNLRFSQLDKAMGKWEAEKVTALKIPSSKIFELASTGEDTWKQQSAKHRPTKEVRGVIEEIQAVLREKREKQRTERVLALSYLNELRCSQRPLYGADVLKLVEVEHPVYDVHKVEANPGRHLEFCSLIADIVQLPLIRCENVMDLIAAFVFAIPAARAPLPVAWCSHLSVSDSLLKPRVTKEVVQEASAMLVPLRPVVVRRQLFFPDRRLLQFDCGKLQELAVLLRRLKSEGHRALIFTQMTKMLDVLESFINLYGYTYMRLDGSTKPEQRQILMQRFNTNPKIFLFILSTRSGGVGINLVGADTVIFYDSDWNPAMDQQAQDRCHRIGQTREVHIYRLVSESTIEENILKKANQKRILDDLVIQSGSYNTEFFKKLDPMELFSGLKGIKVGEAANKGPGTSALVASTVVDLTGASLRNSEQKELSSAEVEAALKNAEDEADYMAMKRVEQEEAAENQEFTEEVFAGNLDDEDLADDLDEGGRGVNPGKAPLDIVAVPSKGDQGLEEGGTGVTSEEMPFGESSVIPADADEEMDMLADVRQMAAAAAASGRGSISFEDQLRPVERYAMRFLELWDPRVDKMAVVAQVAFEEKEWELDQLEKLKEEQEAEIDEDNEPLFYEIFDPLRTNALMKFAAWDTTLADEAYRQQVDILSQQQENQRQLEWEAMEEELRDADRAVAEAAASVLGAENFNLKLKGKKKSKKGKFKSLAENSLISDTEEGVLGGDYLPEKGKDPPYRDSHSDQLPLPHRSPSQRKRKAPKLLEEEMLVEMHTKKLKKEYFKEKGYTTEKGKGKKKSSDGNFFRAFSGDASEYSWPGAVGPDGMVLPGELASSGTPGSASSVGKNKAGGKISIMGMPPKKGPLVMLEKERKKDFARSQDHIPPAAPWTHAEDAVLCAVVHEYGGNWQLASDALAGSPDGGVYRGRHRHPIHCRERFRQLLAQNAAAASGDPSSEKSVLNAATNAQLKVTEEHTKRLLDVVLQLPDDELLLQRHFVAVLSAIQNRKKPAGQQGPDKLSLSLGSNSPRVRGYVPLYNLTKSHPTPVPPRTGSVSVRDVAAALAQADKEPKVVINQSAPKPPIQPLKDQVSKFNDESFNVLEFLESSEIAKLSDDVGQHSTPSGSLPQPIFLEDLLGFPPASTHVPLASSKALRHLAEILVENRFRVATRMGWEGARHDWAAAAGTGTGVVGVHIPTKGKGLAKKRPAPDPSKPPKPKQPKVPKPSNKKGGTEGSKSDQPSPSSTGRVEPPHDSPAQKGEIGGMVSADLLGTPSKGGSVLPARPIPPGNPTRSGAGKSTAYFGTSIPQADPAGSDLNAHRSNELQFETSKKVPNSKKVKVVGAAPGTQGVTKAALKMEKKASGSSKKTVTQSAQVRNLHLASAARVGLEESLGGPVVGGGVGGSNQRESMFEKGADLHDSSDDDLTIIGVSPATISNRLDLSISPRGGGEISGQATRGEFSGVRRHNNDVAGPTASTVLSQATSHLPIPLQAPVGISTFPPSGTPAPLRGGSMGASHKATAKTEVPNLASPLMKKPDWPRLSGSPSEEHFLSPSVLPKELSHLQWPPAPGVWPASFPDLDFPAENMKRLPEDLLKRPSSGGTSLADLPPLAFFRGGHNPDILPFQISPPGEGASPGLGVNPSITASLQTPESGIPSQGHISAVENQFQQHAALELLERQQQHQHHQHASMGDQGQTPSLWLSNYSAANSPHLKLTDNALGYAPTGPPRPPFGTGATQLQHPQSRSHASPSKTPSHFPSSSPLTQLYNHQDFPGFSLPPFPVQESLPDPDLGISLGSGVPKKQPGVGFPKDQQPHTSST